MAFGAVGDPDAVTRFASLTAQEARAVGIHWAFAPIADVNSNPANPVINTRSFGEDPIRVGKMVAAYVRGAHQSGMLVAVKHFPGEGDTSSDPHIRVTQIAASREHLEQYEFPPFRRAIEAGADSVMIANARVPSLDSDPAKNRHDFSEGSRWHTSEAVWLFRCGADRCSGDAWIDETLSSGDGR